MNGPDYFRELLHKRATGASVGIASVCSGNHFVLRAAMQRACARGQVLLVEATANQANQFGGYTGMRPADFAAFVFSLAAECGLPEERLMLGGDHLGPLVWADKPEKEAMCLAEELVAEYVHAGFDKIHLDTSMRLGDDDATRPLPDEVIAWRGARLCRAAEAAHAESKRAGRRRTPPVYVIGSEVPTPGGAQHAVDSIAVTSPAAFRASLAAFRETFAAAGLQDARRRVVAFVVQPGVEFNSTEVSLYDPAAAKALCAALQHAPGLVFEGHSTDYQPPERLAAMVRDGIAILKVGPALTFALREVLMALEQMETVLLYHTGRDLSHFSAVLEQAMLETPVYWAKHYPGDENAQHFQRLYSFFDRARYYLQKPVVEAATQKLLANLAGQNIPLPLLSQYLPLQYKKTACGQLCPQAEELLMDVIGECLAGYDAATHG